MISAFSLSSAVRNMHKTQVFIRDDQYKILQSLMLVTGKKQSALIREGIDLIIKNLHKKQAWKEKMMSLSGSISYKEAEEMKVDIKDSRESWKARYTSL
jgi:tripartite-type tricarboxylate transporter receptor subunit TctC